MRDMEDLKRAGLEIDHNKIEEVLGNSMHRAASVDDLFAPLSGLNVRAGGEPDQPPSSSSIVPQPSDSRPSSQAGSTSATAEGPLSPRIFKVPAIRPHTSAVPDTQYINLEAGQASASVPLVHSSSTSSGQEFSGPEVKYNFGEECPPASESGRTTSKSGGEEGGSATSPSSASQFQQLDGSDAGSSLFTSEQLPAYPSGTRRAMSAAKSRIGKGGGPDAALPPSPSTTSDDDQQNGPGVDERKQRRMLSNRESARRSRLRKQQHLDELRAQVAHLRAENTNMMAKYGTASQKYSHVTNENIVLRSYAEDLTRKLQQVHHEVAAEHPPGTVEQYLGQ